MTTAKKWQKRKHRHDRTARLVLGRLSFELTNVNMTINEGSNGHLPVDFNFI